jgi:uncharacterized protein YacL
MGLFVIRCLFLGLVAAAGWFYPPFMLNREAGAAIAAGLAALAVFLETRIRRVPFRTLWSAFLGTLSGVVLGWLLGSVYQAAVRTSEMATFIRLFFLLVMPYGGFLVGTRKAEWFDPAHLLGFFKEKRPDRVPKIVDTSVIIDGRIADLCDTGFVEGTVLVPQFILKELQLIADSPDGIKRQRGRRGLDVLDRLQKSSAVHVVITDVDAPEVRDADSKLIECAKRLKAKVVTNDFNLNCVARLQGLQVLNVNELAHSLRPVVLPGEIMQVFLIKEGKEKDQGVAYLDDGTMVVVDNARRLIGQTVPITVTSVLQTTVGKMIFGRTEEEGR